MDLVPILNFDQIAHDSDGRIRSVTQSFEQKFGSPPDLVVRVPGRVNIIGEHVDYCGYPVLPMAIEKNILIAASRSLDGTSISLSNTDTSFPDFSCDINEFAINRPPLWHDYFLCGLRGVLSSNSSGDGPPVKAGLRVLVDGSIPPSAGLSSSSALVCGSAVVSKILISSDSRIVKHELASACAEFERLIGTAGGGMDQAIQMLAEAGSAKFFEFVPKLHATSVSLPMDAVFFVSHSGAECNKAASHSFNTRVLETRIAALLMATKMNIGLDNVTLSAVQRKMEKSLSEMPAVVEKCIRKEPYTISKILEELGLTSSDDLLHKLGLSNDSGRFDESLTRELKLRDRAIHVFREAARVHQFKRVCEDNSIVDVDKVKLLGQLMNESHESLRILYECSCPEVDDRVRACLSAGASGSRVTGAGWGGCCISLVRADRVPDFRSKLQQLFPTDSFTFQTTPCPGTTVFVTNSKFNLLQQ